VNTPDHHEPGHYRKKAISFALEIVEDHAPEMFVGNERWGEIRSRDLHDEESRLFPALAFLDAEGLLEWELENTRIFRVLDEPRGGADAP
jgi:hypothetical protein